MVILPIRIGNVNVKYTIDQYPTYNWLRAKTCTRGNERWEPLEYERNPQEHFIICGYNYYVNGSLVKEVRFKCVDIYNEADI